MQTIKIGINKNKIGFWLKYIPINTGQVVLQSKWQYYGMPNQQTYNDIINQLTDSMLKVYNWHKYQIQYNKFKLRTNMEEANYFSTCKKATKDNNSQLVLAKRRPTFRQLIKRPLSKQEKQAPRAPIKKVQTKLNPEKLEIEHGNYQQQNNSQTQIQFMRESLKTAQSLKGIYIYSQQNEDTFSKNMKGVHNLKHGKASRQIHDVFHNLCQDLTYDRPFSLQNQFQRIKKQINNKEKTQNTWIKLLQLQNRQMQEKIAQTICRLRKAEEEQELALKKFEQMQQTLKNSQEYYRQAQDMVQIQQKNLERLHLQKESEILYISINRMQFGARQRVGMTTTNCGINLNNYFNKGFKALKDAKVSRLYSQDIFYFSLLRLYPGYNDILKMFAAKSKIYKVMFGLQHQIDDQDYRKNSQLLFRTAKKHLGNIGKKEDLLEPQSSKDSITKVKVILIGSQIFYKKQTESLINSLKIYKLTKFNKKKILQIRSVTYNQKQRHQFSKVFQQVIKVGYQIIQQCDKIMQINMIHFPLQYIDQCQNVSSMFKQIKKQANLFIWAQLPTLFHQTLQKNYKDLYSLLKGTEEERKQRAKKSFSINK